MNIIKKTCEEANVSYIEMYSGAGHDAINMASFTPSGMIFIPSIGGISHSIDEKSSKESIKLGTEILCKTVKAIDQNNL